ncbi:MAG TPA: hypothetical protein VFA04_02055 [Bryobacteraceae bacterium]|nr:hypothetical protein [Bryobacteraceae bacterium]
MRQFRACFLAFAAIPAFAQAAADKLATEQLDLANQETARISSLVDAGALPRTRLAQAQDQLADLQDQLVIQHTLYGPSTVENLSEKDAQDMVAAAQRRVDRENARIADTQKLIDTGIVARNALEPLRQELSLRQTTLDLANARAQLLRELVASAHLETGATPGATPFSGVEEHFNGKGTLTAADIRGIETAFSKQFLHPLPISAFGETAVHRALGFDHRGRVDVALSPDQKEGEWLRQYLEAKNIPFYAFRAAVAGKATGAHIHIGPGSTRLRRPAVEAD